MPRPYLNIPFPTTNEFDPECGVDYDMNSSYEGGEPRWFDNATIDVGYEVHVRREDAQRLVGWTKSDENRFQDKAFRLAPAYESMIAGFITTFMILLDAVHNDKRMDCPCRRCWAYMGDDWR